MKINYKCPCRNKKECKCEFLKKFERKLAKGVKSKSAHIYCHEDLFPSLSVLHLLVEYAPSIQYLILKNVDFYDLPILCELIKEMLNLSH